MSGKRAHEADVQHTKQAFVVGLLLLLTVGVYLEFEGRKTYTINNDGMKKEHIRKSWKELGKRKEEAKLPPQNVGTSRYLMVSWLLYDSPGEVPRTLPFFLKSASGSGADVVLISTTDIPFAMPKNCKVYRTTKKEIVHRIEQNVFGGVKLVGLRGKDGEGPEGYKSIDFKPLTAVLYPEVVNGYMYWGHVDNDAVVGHVPPAIAMFTHYIPSEVRANDVMMERFGLTECMSNKKNIKNSQSSFCDKGCGIEPCGIITQYASGKGTWTSAVSGPLCWYRNEAESNNAFRYVGVPGLLTAFNKTSAHGFDEWGNKGTGHHDQSNSMLRVVEGILGKRNLKLNVSINKGEGHNAIGFYWDGLKARAGNGACKVDLEGKLTGYVQDGLQKEEMMYFCHYEHTKGAARKVLHGKSSEELDAFAAKGFIWNRKGIFPLTDEKRVLGLK